MKKVQTGITGFDELAEGGLPGGRTVLVSGTAGSGKTLFGIEFLFRGVTEFDENGVFVTFEERRTDIFDETRGFGWDMERLESDGRIAFVDASSVADSQMELGDYDFGALLARIRHAVRKVNAKRVVVDSVSALFLRYRDQALVRREMSRLVEMLKSMCVASVITAERTHESDDHSRFGVEDFVVDAVVLLYNSATGRDRERQIEILKMRGASHRTGRHHFMIDSGGITIFPTVRRRQDESMSDRRLSTGVSGVDEMVGGGLFEGSTTLLLGSSGTGRTVLGLHFLKSGVESGEPGVFFSFEEAAAQVHADAESLGWNSRSAEESGLLKVVSYYPEAMPIEHFMREMARAVEETGAKRVVIDSVTPFASVVDEQRFRRFITGLNAKLKAAGATTLVNYTAGASLESAVAAESDLAVLADNIVVMRLSDSGTGTERELLVVKARASAHDDRARKYAIDADGMRVIDLDASNGRKL